MNEQNSPSSCCGCHHHNQEIDQDRRQAIKWVSMGLTTLPFMGHAVQASDAAPLLLVDADAESNLKPLRPEDLAVGKPLLVYPFDTKTGAPKNESRSNKLVLTRFPEDQMAPGTKSRSAGGVLAYSALCTHQACDVKTWIAKEKVLVCFCHASKFDLLDGAKVVDGPASKPLPGVSLKLEGEFLAIVPSSPANQGS